jgi:DNA-binding MarR family transcriptional regulator
VPGTRTRADRDFDDVQRALETLLRLHASRTVHSKVLEAAGASVSRPGYNLLRSIDEDGPRPLGDLARATHMDPAVASRQIRQLEDDGLVRRSVDAADARVTLVQVTKRGRDVRRRISEVLERHMLDVLESWSPADRRRLSELLGRLVDDLRAVRYRPPPTRSATPRPAIGSDEDGST